MKFASIHPSSYVAKATYLATYVVGESENALAGIECEIAP